MKRNGKKEKEDMIITRRRDAVITEQKCQMIVLGLDDNR